MRRLILLALFSAIANAWHTCDTREFCSRIRNKKQAPSPYSIKSESITTLESSVEADITNSENGKALKFKLTALVDNTFRISIDDPQKRRFSAKDALDGEPTTAPFAVETNGGNVLSLRAGENLVKIHLNPLKIEFVRRGEVSVIINEGGRLTFNSGDGDDEAIALDVTYPRAQRAYGIPEHAERLSLKTTGPGGLNPYRLYNVDYYAYSLETQEALYGAIPVLYGHGTTHTSGVFWLNAAETFVDINNAEDRVNAFFISEAGVLDLFVFTGPTLPAAVRQYAKLTGTHALPQYFALGYHQSRYSYMSQEDVETVIAEFDNHNFPLDVIWLDIDYTDGYKYFTWNLETFPEPIKMQQNIALTGRKLVGILDPHFKVEEGYHVFDQAMQEGYFVKNPDGSVFQGMCWPGLSSYIDFFYPKALNWYANLYLLENFMNSTLDMYIWNDMNEPSVFEAEEKTMDGNLLHYDGWLHRNLHNMYGFQQTVGTSLGLVRRNNRTRPFILTRAHFSGSQRYAAMWTGDNVASWEHFRISAPMLLTQSLAGMSFCGTDVGGFVNNVEDELLQRWYQAGVWYPFFRAHSSNSVDRREPYLYPKDIQARIRTALRKRYAHLPMWYTLWFEHERYGDPVIRPLSYHYTSDAATLDIDNQWLVGPNILVSPVFEKNAVQIRTYLPGGQNELWYDIDNNLLFQGGGYNYISIDMDSAPVFYRGGSIIFRMETPRPSSVHMHNDAYTLYIFEDINGESIGNIYIDDFESFNYRNKEYLYISFYYKNRLLAGTIIDDDANYDKEIKVDRIVRYAVPSKLKGNVNSTVKNRVHKIEKQVTDNNFNIRTPFIKLE